MPDHPLLGIGDIPSQPSTGATFRRGLQAPHLPLPTRGAADRPAGFSRGQLGSCLGRGPQLIQGYIEEMERQGVCRKGPPSKHQDGCQIEVSNDFWPYERDPTRGESDEQLSMSNGFADYSQAIAVWPSPSHPQTGGWRSSSSKRECRCRVWTGRFCWDVLVNAWLLNGQVSGPIASFHYFQGLVEEVGQLQVAADYWRYLELSLNRMEAELLERKSQAETG